MLFGVQPIKAIATSDVAVERLRQQFHLGLVAPGSKLPSERRLSVDMRVARATLREALGILEADGYVEIRRGAVGGAFAPDLPVLTTLMQKRVRRDMASCYRALEFWDVNQVAAAGCAAERRTPGGLKRVREAAGRLLEARDIWAQRSSESELCLAVGAASGNSWLANAVYDSLAVTLLPFAPCEDDAALFPRSAVEKLVVAIEASNPTEAIRSMRRIVTVYANRLRHSRRSVEQLDPRMPEMGVVTVLNAERHR